MPYIAKQDQKQTLKYKKRKNKNKSPTKSFSLLSRWLHEQHFWNFFVFVFFVFIFKKKNIYIYHCTRTELAIFILCDLDLISKSQCMRKVKLENAFSVEDWVHMCTVVTCVHIHAIWEIHGACPVYKRLSEGKQNVNVFFFFVFLRDYIYDRGLNLAMQYWWSFSLLVMFVKTIMVRKTSFFCFCFVVVVFPLVWMWIDLAFVLVSSVTDSDMFCVSALMFIQYCMLKCPHRNNKQKKREKKRNILCFFII